MGEKNRVEVNRLGLAFMVSFLVGLIVGLGWLIASWLVS